MINRIWEVAKYWRDKRKEETGLSGKILFLHLFLLVPVKHVVSVKEQKQAK